jgi:hypothetical protein
MSPEEIQKMRVHWQKGLNHCASFFTELSEVRREIGDDVRFAQWCETELHINLRRILNMTSILREGDAQRTKREFMPARHAELAHRRELRQQQRRSQ